MDRYVGKRLDGRYEIREIIGVGGMAVVYKAYDTIESRIVALKILKQEFVTNEDFVRRFKNESKAIAVLSHPNIVKVYDVSFGDLIQYIVMEYIEGITLKQYIEQNGSIPWKNAVGVVMQILRALQHAHDKGIIHRDVKPQNIILTKDGDIKVTDFGIARFARSDYKTMTDKAIGSVHYISPEQARSEITDEKADLYSVGVILYEMLSGTLPFQAESAVIVAMMQLQNEAKPLREIDPTIPLGLAQITMNAMEKEVLRRYQTAAEMLCDLETFRRDPSSTFERNYFVDDAPTKFIAQDIVNNPNNNDKKPKKNKKKMPIIPILTGVMVGIAILAAAFLVKFVFSMVNESTSGVPCPNFVGMTIDEINEKYDIENYNIKPNYVETNDYRVGEVFRQNRRPGEIIKSKDEIKIDVAITGDLIVVPDVTNQTESVAKQNLKSAGFTNIVFEEIFDDTVVKGKVVKTKPLKDSQISSEDTVTVYISKGEEIIYTIVPDVIGFDESSAKKMLENENLKLGNVTQGESSQPKGYVIFQSISEGTKVKEGTKVDIVISSGESTTTRSLDIKINLPKDCSFDRGVIIAEYAGNEIRTTLLSFEKDESCTINVSSTASTVTLYVKIADESESNIYNYQQISVDFKNKTYKIVKNYNEYPKG